VGQRLSCGALSRRSGGRRHADHREREMTATTLWWLLLLASRPARPAAAGASSLSAAAPPPAYDSDLPPPGVWPLPKSFSCTPLVAAGASLSTDLQLIAAGVGRGADVASAALARYRPLLVGTPSGGAGRAAAEESGTIRSITIEVSSASTNLSASTNYSYSLKFTGGDTITATAASPYGVAYAMETVTQLVNGTRLMCESLEISDEPQFAHRGLMIDSGRRFYPMPVVKTFVDGLAASKMNVLHLFLSEACWRVESKLFPQLTEPGSCVSHGSDNTAFYTQAEIKELVQFARLRGVRVLPEFDQPGHAAGLCATLGNAGLQCCGAQIKDDAAGKSVDIMKSLMTEMASLFPDEVMSIGSDETGGCGDVKAYEVKMIEHLLSIGKQPMGWQEIQLKTGAAAAFPSVVLELWGDGNWTALAETGHRTINANKLLFYLDYPNHMAAPMWSSLYATGTNRTATPTEREFLIGGETAMWGDAFMAGSCLYDSSQDRNFSKSVSQSIWPRTAIAAGSFWGPYRQVPDNYLQATLEAVRSRLTGRGVDSCPCATTASNGCSQSSQCGVKYCPPPPPPLPPAPACAAFGSTPGFSCLGSTTGAASLLIKTASTSCTGAKPFACAKILAAQCDAMEPKCVAFSITGTTATFFKSDPQPPIPAAATKTLLAMPCNPVDPNQAVVFTPFAGGSAGQLMAPGGLCVDVGCDALNHTSRFVTPIPLTPCKHGSLGQTWKRVPTNDVDAPFLQSACPHDPNDLHKFAGPACIDVNCGGMKTADVTVSYACGANDTQYGGWVEYGNTFKEKRDGKCLSIGRVAAGGHAFEDSVSSVAWMKRKPREVLPGHIHTGMLKTDDDLVKIMPLGDSITAGYMGAGMPQCCHATEPTQAEDYSCCQGGGYRSVLGALLKPGCCSWLSCGPPQSPPSDRELRFDFVGSRYHFGDHQGHSGARIIRILQELQHTRSLELYAPDIILLLAGTNDFDLLKDEGGGDPVLEAQANMTLLLKFIARTAPAAQVIVSTVTRLGNGSTMALARPDMQANIDRYNAKLPALLAEHNHSGRLSLAAMDEAKFVQPDQQPPHGDYWSEGVHFNASGWRRMANVWFGAISRVLPRVLQARVAATGRPKPDVPQIRAPRLLPLGDSLTLGVQGIGDQRTCNVSDQRGCVGGGYRSTLGALLKPHNETGEYHRHVDFVGDLSLYGDHQGHSGATFAEIQSNLEARKTMALYAPEFVLVLGGTNDFYQSRTVAQALTDAKSLLASITSSSPESFVLWSTTPLVVPERCTPSSHPVRVFDCPKDMNAKIQALNAQLAVMLAAHERTILVNMSEAVFLEEDYWIGGVHFNNSGWGKMAGVWHRALMPLLPRLQPQLKADDVEIESAFKRTGAKFDPYPVLWDSNSIEDMALVAVGIQPNKRLAVAPNTIQDWPCQDAPKDYCRGEAFGGYCLRGQWPIITSTGNLNGGVPQNASLTAHLAEIRRTMPFGVAANYTGIIAIDFEDWAPIWSEDTSKDGWHSAAYQNLSIALVLQAHPKLSLTQAKAEAKKAFESAALEFFVETIKLCRELRPKAQWGFYGFPQAFTFNGYDSSHGPTLRALNDRLQPIWDASDVLLPSIYLGQWHASAATLAEMNAAQINTTVLESIRLQNQTRHHPEVWPFMYSYYNSGRQNVTLTAVDTEASVAFPYALGATGLVVWGNPSYKNRTQPGTVAQFQKYFQALLGPTIAGVKKAAHGCTAARCHGHGQCVGLGCKCEHGFSPASNCSHLEPQATVRVKADDDAATRSSADKVERTGL
jgi:lysophospholipase L1-like esterase